MNQEEFSYRIRQALNEGAERLDYRTVLRLEQARKKALTRQRQPGPATVRLPALQVATAGGPSIDEGIGPWAWLRGAGLIGPLVALAIGLVAISQWNEQLEIEALAALDFAVLLDEGPLDAYADQGFSVLLQAEHDAQ